MSVPSIYNMSFLEEKDATELAVLESLCFSLPWSEEQYQIFLRHGAEDARKRRESCQRYGEHEPYFSGVGNVASSLVEAAFVSTSFTCKPIDIHFDCWGASPVLGMHDAKGELAAYLSLGLYYGAGELEIYNIASNPSLRRQGLALYLLRFVLTSAARAGMTRAILEVRPSNTPALKLYDQLGFSLCGRRKNYYSDNGEDALVMECTLPIL